MSHLATVIGRLSRHSGVRFLAVGAASIIVDAGSLFLLHGVLGVWLPLATALAFTIAFGVNFGLNRLWTFEATGAMARHLWRYALLVAANLSLTVILVQALTWLGLPYLVSKLCTTAALAVVNYVVSQKWVFD